MRSRLGLALIGLTALLCCGVITEVAVAVGSETPQTLAKFCSLPYVKAEVVHFRSGDGVQVTGAVAGNGRVGVLFANTSGGSMCDWVANDNTFINLLVGKGYRVLLFNYSGKKWDANVVGAAAKLRALGSREVVMVGASTGGIVVIGASTKTEPAPVAVIGLSASGDPTATSTGPAKGGIDGTAAAATLKVPLLLVAAKNDLYAFAPTQALFRATHEQDKQLLIVPGQAHGYFDGDGSASKVNTRVLNFIRTHT